MNYEKIKDEELKKFIISMTYKNPLKRLSVEEALNSNIFQELKDESSNRADSRMSFRSKITMS